MKYWQEYYSAKHVEKHFGTINIGDLDKIIFLYVLTIALILMCVCVAQVSW